MDTTDVDALKASIGKQVVLGFRDGEITVAEPHLVSVEDSDVVYDVVCTNRPERYARAGAAYEAALSDIDVVAAGEILSELIQIVFGPNEEPVFIDASAAVEEITSNFEPFAVRARESLGITVDAAHFAMTLPELALHVRRLRR